MKFILFLIFIFVGDIFAHGGGLDKSGCHRETSTGGYHCHRGTGLGVISSSVNTQTHNKIAKLDTTVSYNNVKDPDLFLLGLLLEKDMSSFEKDNELYKKLETSLTKLVCTGSQIFEFESSSGQTTEGETLEDIQYFAFNSKYFFTKYSTKWIVLEDIEINDSSFSWGYQRINKPLGDTDVSFITKDVDFEVFLRSASQKIYINRETGNFFTRLSADFIFPGKESDDFGFVEKNDGNCTTLGTKKF